MKTKHFFAAIMLLLSVNISAANIIDSGKCGNNLTYTLTDDGVFTISGTGNMYDNFEPWIMSYWLNYDRVKKIIIQEGVSSIGYQAFVGWCNLISITIPESVINIGTNAFYDCSSLTSVNINSGAIIGKNYTSEYNIPSIFGDQVKEYIIGNNVTSIGDHAFYYCRNLTNFSIPNNVTNIGEYAFYGSDIKNVIIPENVISIGFGAFCQCDSLRSVTINSNTIANIETSTYPPLMNIFGDIEEYILGNSVTSIGDGVFSECYGLKIVNIPNSVTSIGDVAFFWCSGLTSVNIPESVTRIGGGAFNRCQHLKSINIPYGVTIIENGTFEETALRNITIPESVISIGNWAFHWCALDSIIIPNSVTSIGDFAFYDSGLESVVIPNSVTYIGARAFAECGWLTSIYNYSTIPQNIDYDDGVFDEVNINTCVLYVPKESIEAYKSAPVWKDFMKIVAIGESVGNAIEEVSGENNTSSVRKVVENGNVHLLTPDGRKLNIQGAEVK